MIDIPFDRRMLEDTFDRTYSWGEIILNSIMAALVAWLAYRLMRLPLGFLGIFFTWAAVAASHFSLLKSPQPDSHSPQHFTAWTAYSRPFYFIIFSIIALAAHYIPIWFTLDNRFV